MEEQPRAEVIALQKRLNDLDAERAALAAQLAVLRTPRPEAQINARDIVTSLSPKKKIALFRRLFSGRSDVFALRWENRNDGRSGYAPVCSNEWAGDVCGKPKIKCGACVNQAFMPVTDETIECHLRATSGSDGRSDFVMGVYPLLRDDTCWFLAADFDGEHWTTDALAYLDTCRARNVPAALERSRSGKGGHVWVFFHEPIAAREARQLGAALMTETMERRPEIGFKSYDRFFPNQDTMPAGGFGNLIALPLGRRTRDRGNSVFVDDNLQPYEDQWAFLASLMRMTRQSVSDIVSDARESGRILAVRLPIDEDEDAANEPWLLPPSRQRSPQPIAEPLPESIGVVLAEAVYVDRSKLPPQMVARLVRLAAFQNPEFYRAQALRLSTYGKPRIISCAKLHPRHIELPRACLWLNLRFLGTLQPEQKRAFEAVTEHDFGVLAATTAFGKTVVAAATIAQRGCSTLVLVHRRELLAQWVERLKTFLSIDHGDIGVIGGGRRKPTGRIDVALVQSLIRNDKVSDLVGGYGHLIVDECHHLSATTFEMVAQRSKARYVLGLSATVARKDGRHPIIFMQCGPVRYRVDPRAQAARRSFEHLVQERATAFRFPGESQMSRTSVTAILGHLAKDEERNRMIVDDVLSSLEAGRNPLVLTKRRDHLQLLADCFKGAARNIVVLRGGMSAAERKAADASLNAAEGEERLLLATGRYLGEGFDDVRLDTLFLAMPISWRGTLAQYVGRLQRDHVNKREVIVYDYVDGNVPVLERMASRRRAGYRALGYSVRLHGRSPQVQT